MGIHVIQSQRVDVLVEAMLKTVRKPAAHPLEVLKTQHFIVPSPAVEAWLTQRLAEHQSICANTEFHHRIRGFQWSAYQWVLHDQKDLVRQANIPRIIIKWRVFQALKEFIQPEQNPLASSHALFPIIQRIYASADRLEQPLERQLKKQSMLYWVAEQVSKLFSHYMTYRGHCQKGCGEQCRCPTNWLMQWGRDQALDLEQMFFKTDSEVSGFMLQQAEELEAWQRWLWQAVFHEDFEQMQQIDQLFWQALGNPEQPGKALRKLPKQLVVFTLLDLPPQQLQFLRRLGQYIEIFILHYNPSQEYWADSVDPNWKARYDARVKQRFLAQHPQANDAEITQFFEQFTLHFNAQNRESRHPLLTRLGKQARDHFSLLSALSSGEEGVWADLFIDDYQPSLLGKLQADILYLNEPAAHQYALEQHDDSIQIHVCHSSLRQLEVLKDQLLHWLSEGTKEQPRRPSDILVLSPNLKEIEPLIRSVFAPPPSARDLGNPSHDSSRLAQHSVYLPIQIAGVSQLDVSNAWRAVAGRIRLLQGRFSLDEFADWLGLAASLQRYELDIAQLERLLELLSAAGFKRGFDAEHLQRSLSADDQDYRFSFKFALDRLALGLAIPEHTLFQDTLCFAEVMPADFELIAKLIQIYQDLAERRHWMIAHERGENTRAEQWLKRLMQDIDEFSVAGVTALENVYKIIKKQYRMLTLASYYDEQDRHALAALSLPLPYILEEIEAQLAAQLEQAEPSGQITFCQLGQLRPLPYKLVVMLNLDSGKFPNRNVQLPFDLMQLLKPQLGDRSRLEDDQGAFLDALLLAQDKVWLFYNGFDVNDGQVRDPSSILQELIQHLALIVAAPQPESALNQTVNIDGIEVPEQLRQLYCVHRLQPFDPLGFESSEIIRFQDQWYAVAQQIRQPGGQRSHWANQPYPLLTQDLQVLDSQQWIQDMIFPARLYLKSVGVENLRPEQRSDQAEPLLLDGLGRYTIRDFLKQQHNTPDPALLQDRLPIGKIREGSWTMSLVEQQQLQARLQHYAPSETTVTRQVWKVRPDLHIRLTLPKQGAERWVSLEASSARAKRRTALWLEYLLWLAYLNLGDGGQQHQRIVVFSDDTVCCEGVSSNQARQWLEHWFKAWDYGQRQPLVLPSALLLKVAEKGKQHEWEPDAEQRMQLKDLEGLYKDWNDSGQFSAFSVADNEACKHHRDWQFILQEQDTSLLLAHACEQFSYDLYQPIFWHQQTLEE
ncbi:exodeoxyribonuclease V subunit gamma [Acinetobacter indicus]|uniref:exodeoxyribonuclease V subunit gamma n=1 Tax=Acinetobacter indicus TaxID=756892 RepID=UPI000CEC3782|nr:exodeoxyribonuclease V subunit gamma [Acinetobacter indicus]